MFFVRIADCPSFSISPGWCGSILPEFFCDHVSRDLFFSTSLPLSVFLLFNVFLSSRASGLSRWAPFYGGHTAPTPKKLFSPFLPFFPFSNQLPVLNMMPCGVVYFLSPFWMSTQFFTCPRDSFFSFPYLFQPRAELKS